MKTFAEYLDEYMSHNKLSQNFLSNCLNISRRTLGRYLSGECIPNKLDKVTDIAKTICPTEEEQTVLIEIWKNDKRNRSYSAESSLLEAIFKYDIDCGDNLYGCNMEENMTCGKFPLLEDNCTVLFRGGQIIECIRHILNTSGKIRIRANSGIEIVDSLLNNVASSRSNISIEQIIVIEKNNDKKGEKIVNAYEKMLPVCMGKAKYKAYCCYSEKLIERSMNRELYMLSDKGLLLFDGKLTRGLFSNQPEYFDYFNMEFDMLSDKCNILCEGYDTNLFDKYYNAVCCEDSDYKNTKVYYLQNDSHVKICVHKSQSRTRVLFIEEPQIVYGLRHAMKLRSELRKRGRK